MSGDVTGLCLYIRLQLVFGHTQSCRNVYSCQKKVTFAVFSIRSSFFDHLDSVILTSLTSSPLYHTPLFLYRNMQHPELYGSIQVKKIH